MRRSSARSRRASCPRSGLLAELSLSLFRRARLRRPTVLYGTYYSTLRYTAHSIRLFLILCGACTHGFAHRATNDVGIALSDTCGMCHSVCRACVCARPRPVGVRVHGDQGAIIFMLTAFPLVGQQGSRRGLKKSHRRCCDPPKRLLSGFGLVSGRRVVVSDGYRVGCVRLHPAVAP